MNKEQYKKLNNYLNDVFIGLENKDFFLLENINELAKLNDSFNKFISNYKLDNKIKENNLTFEDVYLLSREIIESINKEYLKDFDQMIENGSLDFSYNNEYFDSHYSHIENNNQITNLINVNRNFNYSDVRVLVHEFIHYTNGNNKKISINHHLLTEFLSIYFEMYAIDYLIDKGIPKEEIDYNNRLISTKVKSKRMLIYEIVLLAYEKFGNINENTVDDLNEYYLKIPKEAFDRECLICLKNFKKFEKNYIEDIKYEKDFNKEELIDKLCLTISNDYRYIFGTLLAFYTIKNCDIKDIIYLNDHINDYEYANKSLYDVLLTINVNIKPDDFEEKIFESISEYINKYNSLQR